MKKKLLYSLGSLLVVFLLIQLHRPVRSNPPIDPSETISMGLDIPEEVDAILRRSCYNCHSNETKWPWYSSIAPASWLVASDVKNARQYMNFSTWNTYRKAKRLSLLESICNVTSGKLMPLPQYLLLHPEAKLTHDEIEILCQWSDSQISALFNRPE